MRDAKLLSKGQDPNSDDVAEGSNRLNDLIAFWQTTGLRLWLNEDTNVPLTAGQGLYTFGPAGTQVMAKPMRVIEAYYNYFASGQTFENRRPVYPLAWDDWIRLSQVNQQGQINSYFADKQQDLLRVNFWLVPDSVAATEGSMHLLLQVPVTHFTSVTETMNFPVEWFMALRKALAVDWATGQPSEIIQKLQSEALTAKDILDGWDVEDAPTSFAPDMRMGQGVGRFR